MNLRAALFRVLSDLKKNGDLGRESILRKSMLDDCKGDKFDELLALFSTAVLRKSLAGTVEDNVALRLSMAEGVTRDDIERIHFVCQSDEDGRRCHCGHGVRRGGLGFCHFRHSS